MNIGAVAPAEADIDWAKVNDSLKQRPAADCFKTRDELVRRLKKQGAQLLRQFFGPEPDLGYLVQRSVGSDTFYSGPRKLDHRLINDSHDRMDDKIKVTPQDIAQQKQAMKKAGPAPAATGSGGGKKGGRRAGGAQASTAPAAPRTACGQPGGPDRQGARPGPGWRRTWGSTPSMPASWCRLGCWSRGRSCGSTWPTRAAWVGISGSRCGRGRPAPNGGDMGQRRGMPGAGDAPSSGVPCP